tara:strand:+ start:13223 stop:13345 length:123 start_codon:yes stop_codon:yes gene_type:complete
MDNAIEIVMAETVVSINGVSYTAEIVENDMQIIEDNNEDN